MHRADQRVGGRLLANPEQAAAMVNLPIRLTTPDQQQRLLEAAQRNAMEFMNRSASPRHPLPIPPLPPVTPFSASASLGAAIPAAAAAAAVTVLGKKVKAAVEGASLSLEETTDKKRKVEDGKVAVRTLVLSSSPEEAAQAQAAVHAMSLVIQDCSSSDPVGTSVEAWNDLMTDVNFGTSLLSPEKFRRA